MVQSSWWWWWWWWRWSLALDWILEGGLPHSEPGESRWMGISEGCDTSCLNSESIQSYLLSMLVCSDDTNTNCTQKNNLQSTTKPIHTWDSKKPSKKYQQPTNPTCFSWKILWAPHAGWDGAEFSCIQRFLRRPGCEGRNKQSQLTNPTSLEKTVGMGRDSCSFLQIPLQVVGRIGMIPAVVFTLRVES